MDIGTKLFGHDSSIFYLNCDERELFGLDTERVTRIKHDQGITTPAINTLFKNYKTTHSITNSDSDMYYFVCYPPFWHDEYLRRMVSNRKLNWEGNNENILKYKLFHLPFHYVYSKIPWNFKTFISEKFKTTALNICKRHIEKNTQVKIKKMKGIDHHTCHAASTFFFSPYKKALSVTLDGFGDGYSSKVFLGKNKELELLYETKCDVNKGFSIGRFYNIITEILGLIPQSDEGKVEALAAYGRYKNNLYDFLMKNTILRKNDGVHFETTKELSDLLWDRRKLSHMREKYGSGGFAAAIQKWLEDIGVKYVSYIMEQEGTKKICFSGGVFANVKLNQQIFERLDLDEMYIFPAMSDNGCAAGAAVLEKINRGEDIDWIKKCEMPYWGPAYIEDEVKKAINVSGLDYEYLGSSWLEYAAHLISKGNIIAIFKDRMEYGPRALGNRSVLANPGDIQVKDVINNTIKRRKWYQPFCPSILESERRKIFEKSYKNKHMTCAFTVKEEYREIIPAVTHIDYTARAQFVEKDDNPDYYHLLKALKQETGIGVVLNTSFNLHGRPIVMTPEHAIKDFVDCGLDYLIIEGFLVSKKSVR